MLLDVTIGQYYIANSVIHRLDPRTKIHFTFFYILILFLDRNLLFFAMATTVLLVGLILSKVPFLHMLRGSGAILGLIAVCSALNIATTSGVAFAQLGGIALTYEGLVKAGFVFWRMLLVIFMASLLMYTTTPTELTDGFEKCFHLGPSVALGMTIALRFVPILFEEMNRILRAQEARGATFIGSGIKNKIAMLKITMIPLFQSAIDKAKNLGEAMDARCYQGGKNRTKLKPLEYSSLDVICYILLFLFILASAFLIMKF